VTARPKNDAWMADFTVAGTRHRAFGFASQAEAVAWELEARAALMRGQALPVSTPVVKQRRTSLTIGELIRHCAAVHWAGMKAPSMVRNARLFGEFFGLDQPASECLTTLEVGRYVEHLRKGERSSSTINRHLSSVAVLGKYAKAMSLIADPPLVTWQKEGKGRIRWFTQEEEDTVLNTLRLWGELAERDLFIFLADTGFRLGEALNLEWSNIGPGDRIVTLYSDQTKNSTDRAIVTTARVREVLARRRALAGNQTGPFAVINSNTLHTLWSRLRTHHPFLEDAVMHTYRHTCASRLVMAGVELVRVKEWMGHKAIQTTLRYAHLAPKAMEDVASALERKHA
jgi:integrase